MDRQLYLSAVMFIDSLDRRYGMNKDVGWIYAMRNIEFKRPLLKIGMTSRPPFERAVELASATGVPGAFDLIYFVHVFSCRQAERFVHERLVEFRCGPAKEFFEVPLGRVVDAFDAAAERFPINVDQARPRKRGGWGKGTLPQVFHHVINTCPHCGQRNKVRGLAVSFRPKCSKCGGNLLV